MKRLLPFLPGQHPSQVTAARDPQMQSPTMNDSRQWIATLTVDVIGEDGSLRVGGVFLPAIGTRKFVVGDSVPVLMRRSGPVAVLATRRRDAIPALAGGTEGIVEELFAKNGDIWFRNAMISVPLRVKTILDARFGGGQWATNLVKFGTLTNSFLAEITTSATASESPSKSFVGIFKLNRDPHKIVRKPGIVATLVRLEDPTTWNVDLFSWTFTYTRTMTTPYVAPAMSLPDTTSASRTYDISLQDLFKRQRAAPDVPQVGTLTGDGGGHIIGTFGDLWLDDVLDLWVLVKVDTAPGFVPIGQGVTPATGSFQRYDTFTSSPVDITPLNVSPHEGINLSGQGLVLVNASTGIVHWTNLLRTATLNRTETGENIPLGAAATGASYSRREESEYFGGNLFDPSQVPWASTFDATADGVYPQLGAAFVPSAGDAIQKVFISAVLYQSAAAGDYIIHVTNTNIIGLFVPALSTLIPSNVSQSPHVGDFVRIGSGATLEYAAIDYMISNGSPSGVDQVYALDRPLRFAHTVGPGEGVSAVLAGVFSTMDHVNQLSGIFNRINDMDELFLKWPSYPTAYEITAQFAKSDFPGPFPPANHNAYIQDAFPATPPYNIGSPFPTGNADGGYTHSRTLKVMAPNTLAVGVDDTYLFLGATSAGGAVLWVSTHDTLLDQVGAFAFRPSGLSLLPIIAYRPGITPPTLLSGSVKHVLATAIDGDSGITTVYITDIQHASDAVAVADDTLEPLDFTLWPTLLVLRPADFLYEPVKFDTGEDSGKEQFIVNAWRADGTVTLSLTVPAKSDPRLTPYGRLKRQPVVFGPGSCYQAIDDPIILAKMGRRP